MVRLRTGAVEIGHVFHIGIGTDKNTPQPFLFRIGENSLRCDLISQRFYKNRIQGYFINGIPDHIQPGSDPLGQLSGGHIGIHEQLIKKNVISMPHKCRQGLS